MSALTKALQDVRHKIPREILELAFVDRDMARRALPVSLDTLIRTKVIEDRIHPDINFSGGVETTINLSALMPERVDNMTVLYRIPKSFTQGRSIVNPLSVSFGETAIYATPSQGSYGNSSTLLDAANQALASRLPIPMVGTARVRLVAENTVVIEDIWVMPRTLHLRCVLESDPEFSHIEPPTYPAFCKLVELATKAYIFVNLAIQIDESYLRGGMSLGRIREIVDGYADANELYEEYLRDTWRATSVLNDAIQKRRHLTSIMPGSN